MKLVKLAWRQTMRDLAAGEIRLMLMALILAVMAVTAVGMITDRRYRHHRQHQRHQHQTDFTGGQIALGLAPGQFY